MAMFSGIAERLFGVVGQLRPASDRLPLTKAKWIWSELLTRDGNNDVDSLLKWLDDNKGRADVQERLVLAAGDVVLGEKVVPSWGDVNASGAEGGISFDSAPTLAKAEAKTDWMAPKLAISNSFALFRVPHGSDPRLYSVTFEDTGSGGLNLTSFLGTSDDDNWDFYEERVTFTGEVTLQHSSHIVGNNTWGGKLGTKATRQIDSRVAEAESDLEGQIRAGVENAERFASDLVSSVVFGDAGSVAEWPDPTAADAAPSILVSETLRSTHTVPAAQSKESTDQTVSIGHEPGIYVLTTGAAADQMEFEVGKSQAADGGSDIDYGATQRVFNWQQDARTRHVPTVGEVLHSPLGSVISGFVELTNGNAHDSYAMLLEESLWQAWTSFGNRTFFAHMNRTKQDGTALHVAVEMGGSDTVVRIHGVSYRVFQPFASIPSARQHFLRQAYEENQGDSAAAVAARKVSVYFNGAANDTSTRFFLGGSPKGYTLSNAEYGTERPVLSPSVRHLTALTATDYAALATKETDTIYAVDGVGLYHGKDLLTRPGHSDHLWSHETSASNWHASGGGQILGAGVAQKIWDGLGGDDAWSGIEAEISWVESGDPLNHMHIGLIIFPGWRAAAIGSNLPVRLHGIARFGGLNQTSSLNGILQLVARGSASSQNSHMWVENFNPDGQTGIVAATQVTVNLYGVR